MVKISCRLTTGADGTTDGSFDLSPIEVNPGITETLPLQGELFVNSANGTTVRLQCQSDVSDNVVGDASFQALKVVSVTISP